jgi:quinol monooxygenase YgiN
MVGFEILVKIEPEKRAEFLQAFEMFKQTDQQNDNRIDFELFEQVQGPKTFLWVEHWDNGESLSSYYGSHKFISMMGAIEVLGQLIHKRSFKISEENEHG